MRSRNSEEFQRVTGVSRETIERLEVYEALLQKWNPRINLVSRQTLPELWARHFLDSAQLYDLVPEGAQRWVDLGSGGGFPGLVVAILARETRPSRQIVLVEADLRKSAFLSTVIRDLSLNAKVLSARIEAAPPQAADILSARALAPLENLLGFAERHLAAGGTALFPKGAGWSEELAQARQNWSFDCDAVPSETSPDARILKITGAERG